MSTHNLCFEQKYEKYQSFLSENFQFLEVKFSIYLNRHVFVMFRINYAESTSQAYLVRFKRINMSKQDASFTKLWENDADSCISKQIKGRSH